MAVMVLALHCAKKMPPESSCPRGAKDSKLFRERLDGVGPQRPLWSRWRAPKCVRSAPPASVLVVKRFAVRRNRPFGQFPDADPATWIVFLIPPDGGGSVVFFLLVRPASKSSVRSRGGEDRQFAFSRQGRFSRSCKLLVHTGSGLVFDHGRDVVCHTP